MTTTLLATTCCCGPQLPPCVGCFAPGVNPPSSVLATFTLRLLQSDLLGSGVTIACGYQIASSKACVAVWTAGQTCEWVWQHPGTAQNPAPAVDPIFIGNYTVQGQPYKTWAVIQRVRVKSGFGGSPNELGVWVVFPSLPANDPILIAPPPPFAGPTFAAYRSCVTAPVGPFGDYPIVDLICSPPVKRMDGIVG